MGNLVWMRFSSCWVCSFMIEVRGLWFGLGLIDAEGFGLEVIAG